MAKGKIRVESVEAFFERGRRFADLADRSSPMPCSRVVAFDDVEALLRLLTEKRVSLLKELKQNPGSIADLARRLKRDRSAVTRDIQLLERYGVVQVTEKTCNLTSRILGEEPAGGTNHYPHLTLSPALAPVIVTAD